MKGLDVLLLDGFRENETNAGTTCGFADCLRIVGVVLVGLHKWLHKLRGDKPHGMTRRSQPPRPIMRTSTRFQFLRRSLLGWRKKVRLRAIASSGAEQLCRLDLFRGVEKRASRCPVRRLRPS